MSVTKPLYTTGLRVAFFLLLLGGPAAGHVQHSASPSRAATVTASTEPCGEECRATQQLAVATWWLVVMSGLTLSAAAVAAFAAVAAYRIDSTPTAVISLAEELPTDAICTADYVLTHLEGNRFQLLTRPDFVGRFPTIVPEIPQFWMRIENAGRATMVEVQLECSPRIIGGLGEAQTIRIGSIAPRRTNFVPISRYNGLGVWIHVDAVKTSRPSTKDDMRRRLVSLPFVSFVYIAAPEELAKAFEAKSAMLC